MEPSDKLYSQIEKLSNQGNQAMDNDDYLKAISYFQQAYELLPSPKEDWDAYVWLVASIGDAYFMMQDYKSSLDYFCQCYKSGEIENPFIMLRMGENYFELQDYDNAKEFLLRAFMVEGKSIFKNEKKYFGWLSENVDLTKSKRGQKKQTRSCKSDTNVKEENDLLMQYIDESMAHGANAYQYIIEVSKRYWDMLSEPKIAHSISYHLFLSLINSYLFLEEYEKALHWAIIFETFDFEADGRYDSGEKDFYVAICYHKNGCIDKAREYFINAKKKSRGRCFNGKWGEIYKDICKELGI